MKKTVKLEKKAQTQLANLAEKPLTAEELALVSGGALPSLGGTTCSNCIEDDCG